MNCVNIRTSETSIKDLVERHDVVISTFNAGRTNPNVYNDFLSGTNAILAGTKESGVVAGGAGSLGITPGNQLIDNERFMVE
ncbi:MAG: hypothetical protein QM669_15615 [Siphonobacter sp.]